MDHGGRYGQPTFTAGDPRLHFHSTIPSLVSDEVPFYMHQVLNPNAPPPHTFGDTTTVSPAPPPPYSQERGRKGGLLNLNQGTSSNAQSTSMRWPRQETLALLEIRSRLDRCFKEATSSNHKAPLWDEISRIMNDEYGYQRSGIKCKEKFENLYKYYKKTKEGEVGKTDGKHYRFFHQLDALFRDQRDLRSITTNIAVYPISQSNHSCENNKRSDHDFKKKELITTIEESVELHFEELMVKQEQWGEKILCAIEQKEQERVVIEEKWRKQVVTRLDQEYDTWASHVASIKTRDDSLVEALCNLIKVRSIGSSLEENECLSDGNKCKDWTEPEISSLIRTRTKIECKFQDVDEEHEERLWEEVAFEMSVFGYNRSENECKDTWNKICVDFNQRKMERENTSKEVSGTNQRIFTDGQIPQ
ncbi:hypothetical protein L1987_76279 [Smallanthus sonchifolius]|uniref:Uncharacterized protein n=1 Tax=Smallanthus sonchifolius TaxID=185202 RepID=A0ACB9A7R4_9ASTR|nr:hypothetical protein L1987_76279 [Smallanthus sonchifolius]